ncbi:MAG: CBS domain-containing protein [Methanobacterium sp.]|jgi:predicted transcriptional regulator
MLKKCKVKEVMSEDVITVSPEEDVVFAFEKLMKYKVGSLPVVDYYGKLVGIVTATDLGHNLILDKYELGTTVSEVMVTNVACIGLEDSLKTAVEKMNEYGADKEIVNQLVVVDGHKIKGIISDGDIIKALIS